VGLSSTQKAGRTIVIPSINSVDTKSNSQANSQPWFGPAVKYICAAGAAAASLLLGLTFPGLSAQTPLMSMASRWHPGAAVKFSSRQVVCGDESARLGIPATRKLPDEQVVTEASEIKRSQSHPTERLAIHHVRDGQRRPWTINVHKLGPDRRFQSAHLLRGAHR